MNEIVYMGAAVLLLIFIIICALAFKKTDTETEDFDEMSGGEFEDFTADLLYRNGIEVVEVTKSSGDFGADIIIVYEGERMAVQCKRYAKPVGVKAVQEAVSSKSYYKCTRAAVITNSTFTRQAVSLAEESKVILWDRDDIIGFLNNADGKACRTARGSLKFHRLLSGEKSGEAAQIYINNEVYELSAGETTVISVQTGEVKILLKSFNKKSELKIILAEETRSFIVGDYKKHPILSEIS